MKITEQEIIEAVVARGVEREDAEGGVRHVIDTFHFYVINRRLDTLTGTGRPRSAEECENLLRATRTLKSSRAGRLDFESLSRNHLFSKITIASAAEVAVEVMEGMIVQALEDHENVEVEGLGEFKMEMRPVWVLAVLDEDFPQSVASNP